MSTSHGRFNEYLSLSSPFFSQPDGYDYTSLYPSISPPNPNLNSRLFSPLTPNSVDYTSLSKYLFTEHQEDLMERRKWCLSHLRETAKEAETLRQENINLQIANIELNKQFNNLLMLQSSSLGNCHVSPTHQYNNMASSAAFSSPSLIDGFQGMCITEKTAAWDDEGSDASIETEDGENLHVNRVSLPKSISVRSNGYLKTVQAGGSTSRGGGRFRVPNRIKPVKPAVTTPNTCYRVTVILNYKYACLF